MPRSLCLACLVALASVAAVDAQAPEFWSFLGRGRVVKRCGESSVAHQRAESSLERLDGLIEKLQSADRVDRPREEVLALLKTECFWMAVEAQRVPQPDSAESLKRWWEDGGRDWLASYLELPRMGPMDGLVSHVVVPPDTRKTLTLDAHRDHPLRSLLCPKSDAACGAETRGWRLRAEAHFADHHALGRRESFGPDEERRSSGVKATSEACANETSAGKTGDRYQAWRTCIENHRPKQAALPFGEFKAPTAGWVIISGRRGHYEFCDTTRAYDLSTGAAFVSESCSDLHLNRDGSVDRTATNRARVEHVRTGTVSVENLREAVWMMLFRSETQDLQIHAEFYPMPRGLAQQVTVQEEDLSFGRGTAFSTSQTSLAWLWLPPTGSAFTGEVVWPFSYDAAEDHLASLLKVAEESLAEGCAPRAVPPAVAFTSRAVRNLDEVHEELVKELRQALGKASETWKSQRVCKPGER